MFPQEDEAALVRHGTVSVEYRDPRDRAELSAVYRAWDSAAADLRAIGLTVPAVRIEAAKDAADFAARTGEPASIAASTLRVGHPAVIRTQRLSALAARGLLPTTIRHEAFHAAQPAGIARWLAEGLARNFSGEGRGDPTKPTTLESLNGAELDAALLARDPSRLKAAYREATRRAAALLGRQGWRALLGLPPR
ncbi:hypothetical protein [Deinococcus sp.]|uniref:hypothetical protein n=1 Tax=Deinococcus sp. TaxID=47478 RepID=UPI003CC5685D